MIIISNNKLIAIIEILKIWFQNYICVCVLYIHTHIHSIRTSTSADEQLVPHFHGWNLSEARLLLKVTQHIKHKETLIKCPLGRNQTEMAHFLPHVLLNSQESSISATEGNRIAASFRIINYRF